LKLLGFIVLAILFIAANAYVSVHMYQGIKAFAPRMHPVPFFVSCGVVFLLAMVGVARPWLPLSRGIKNLLNGYSAYWMSVVTYLILLFPVGDLSILLLRRIRKALLFSPKVCLIELAVVAGCTLLIVICGLIHAGTFVHKSYQVECNKDLQGEELKIVMISDLHLGATNSEGRLENMVEEINKEQADVVCIAGDLFDNDFEAIRNPEQCAATLRKISAKYGVYACLGNHDSGETCPQMIAFLPTCNITLLCEEALEVDGRFVLAGRLDEVAMGDYAGMERLSLDEVVEGVDRTLPVIVMDHRPTYIDEYPDWVDLVLSGHTHYGQVTPGQLVTEVMYPKAYGYYRKTAASPQMIVSSGAGTWGPPIRVGTDNEIVTIYLRGAEASENSVISS